MITRRNLTTAAFAVAAVGVKSVRAQLREPVRIGVLDDLSSTFSDQQGMGDVLCAQMAVQDFGGEVLGRAIEVLSADLQIKPDVASAIATDWYDKKNVQMITGIGHSGSALAVQRISQAKNRIQLNTAPGTSDLTGKACAPASAQWVFDTYSLSKATAGSLTRAGNKTWFFLTPDYAFGYSLQSDATRFIEANGGRVIGSALYPTGTADYSSFLFQAQASGAQTIAFCNSGNDLVNVLKQANEFGISAGPQKIVALITFITNVKAVGLDVCKGLVFTEAFYWDQSDATRTFSRRFADKMGGRPPTSLQAGTYSAVNHYLKAVRDSGTLEASKVVNVMQATPINDFMTKNGVLRKDGRVVRDMFLFQVKTPQESQGPWDLLKLIGTIPGEEAFRPLAESECPYIKT